MTTTEKPSPLTINVFKAYLNPLLKKHENGKVIVYEDLMASWDAVEAVLSENGSAPDAGSVKEKIKTIHDTQVFEYKRAGKRALIEYSKTCPLPAGDASDPNHILKCIRQALMGAPDWKLPRSAVLAILQKGIQERLSKTPPSPSKSNQTGAPTDTKVASKESEPIASSAVEEGEEEEGQVEEEETAPGSGDEGEAEDGEEVEDGEEAEEEEAADEDKTKKADNTGTKKTKGLLAKKKALGKTTPPKKKSMTIKGGRTGVRGRTARRGGRAGGKA